MIPKPICRDCQWFDPTDGGNCLHAKAIHINLVTGEELRHNAYQMRVYDHLCGMSGKHFEAFPDTVASSMPAEPF